MTFASFVAVESHCCKNLAAVAFDTIEIVKADFDLKIAVEYSVQNLFDTVFGR